MKKSSAVKMFMAAIAVCSVMAKATAQPPLPDPSTNSSPFTNSGGTWTPPIVPPLPVMIPYFRLYFPSSFPGSNGVATGINAGGTMAGYTTYTNNSKDQGFIWPDDSSNAMHLIGTLTNGGVSYLFGINDTNLAVGDGTPVSGVQDILSFHGTTLLDLGSTNSGGSAGSGINTSGAMVGYSPPDAVYISPSGVTQKLPALSGSISCKALSIDSLIVGACETNGSVPPSLVLWSSDRSTLQNISGGDVSNGIPARIVGTNIVGYASLGGASIGAFIANTNPASEHILPGGGGGDQNHANGITSNGIVAVGDSLLTGNAIKHGWLWVLQNGSYTPLDLNSLVINTNGTGGYIESAAAINENGQIACTFRINSTNTVVCRLDPAQEPLLAIGPGTGGAQPITLTGQPGVYQIQTATNADAVSWTTIVTLTNTTGTNVYTNTPSGSQGFYRAIVVH